MPQNLRLYSRTYTVLFQNERSFCVSTRQNQKKMAVLKHRYTIRTFARTILFIFAFNLKLKFQNALDNERKPHKLLIYSPRKEHSLKSAIAYQKMDCESFCNPEVTDFTAVQGCFPELLSSKGATTAYRP